MLFLPPPNGMFRRKRHRSSFPPIMLCRMARMGVNDKSLIWRTYAQRQQVDFFQFVFKCNWSNNTEMGSPSSLLECAGFRLLWNHEYHRNIPWRSTFLKRKMEEEESAFCKVSWSLELKSIDDRQGALSQSGTDCTRCCNHQRPCCDPYHFSVSV